MHAEVSRVCLLGRKKKGREKKKHKSDGRDGLPRGVLRAHARSPIVCLLGRNGKKGREKKKHKSDGRDGLPGRGVLGACCVVLIWCRCVLFCALCCHGLERVCRVLLVLYRVCYDLLCAVCADTRCLLLALRCVSWSELVSCCCALYVLEPVMCCCAS